MVNTPAQSAPQAMPVIPFVAAAHEHTEPVFDVTVTPGANPQALGPYDLPAFGFARHLLIVVETSTAGVLGAGVAREDYPFNLINSIGFNDVNGAPIFGPFDGYETFLTNVFGGYSYIPNPKSYPSYSNTLITPNFMVRVPLEINHEDGMGALANQNAAASYKIPLTVNSITGAYSTAPTTAPTIRIRGFLEAWTLPNETDREGRPQATFPPMHGTTQYWSKFTKAIAVSNNSVLLPRVGNLVRNLVVVCRNATPVRADNVWLDPVRLTLDQRDLYNEAQVVSGLHTYERTGVARETGVFNYSFAHSQMGRNGDGPQTLLLPTTQSSRLEFTGSAVAAGTVTVLTNDIAPAEIVPAERYVETSRSGGSPGSSRGGAYSGVS